MKVMVGSNTLNIVNGTRGTFVDIILNPQEPPLGVAPIVGLKYSLHCLLFKLNRVCAICLGTPNDGMVSTFPSKSSMQTALQNKSETVVCCQYPMMATYRFTEYHPQGQTIPHSTHHRQYCGIQKYRVGRREFTRRMHPCARD